ncbi:1,6-anhydro-N-acetylmuramyl-L-alanine amidase AmpD [Ascidiaceihabitans donghaensis]|uniref:N-acetylmuramoyl-L-alanine amidase n=1 Tax=Ascidiaceihabitans donghaensis TaxID=1510460 RepID=A0A2R8BD52_9RHOB|nr:N-acetylmuramoyl-L-alanine amidase [Ascidiaceihabitans donghaensis]SPH21005.1 1,6-anhydro-N-acetylmuramyl-L-alanine amidase AmpD [Ascidiaceihabitans donghaensis]
MQLQNHLIAKIPFQQATRIGREIKPRLLVLHDTAGRLDKGNSADFLRNHAKVSVHFVLERDGFIEQQVPTNRHASHAGRSSYKGASGVNGFSVGIEIVNPGLMTSLDGVTATTWFGQNFDIIDHGIQYAETPHHGAGWWMPYTEQQITSLTELLRCLCSGISTIEDIVPHWFISPGRKIDTNPLFPLDSIRALVLGRDDPEADKAEEGSKPVPSGRDDLAMIHAPGDSLNMRRWPSFAPNVLQSIPHGTVVPIVRAGVFEGRDWIKVVYGGIEGWVVKSHTKQTGASA